jgi:hypothetical protein
MVKERKTCSVSVGKLDIDGRIILKWILDK